MARIVRIAAAQAPIQPFVAPEAEQPTPDERKAERRVLIERLAAEAAGQKADIVCFAEHATTQGLSAPADRRDIWEDALDGPTARWAGELAGRLGLWLLLPVKGTIDGRLRNVAVLYDRGGRIVGHYCKVHATLYEREAGLVPGDDWPVFETEVGRLGVIICHDMSFPEAARCLALNGAEVLFWPTHWSGWGEHHDAAVIASRAIDNACWLVQVGLAPRDGRPWRPGMNIARSGVIDPCGRRLSDAGDRVGVSVAEVDLDAGRIVDTFSRNRPEPFRDAMLADRRPDAYGPITHSR